MGLCNLVVDFPPRLFIVMLSTGLYVLVLSSLTRARTTDMVVAATTYVSLFVP
jgi:hypothetical protein